MYLLDATDFYLKCILWDETEISLIYLDVSINPK